MLKLLNGAKFKTSFACCCSVVDDTPQFSGAQLLRCRGAATGSFQTSPAPSPRPPILLLLPLHTSQHTAHLPSSPSASSPLAASAFARSTDSCNFLITATISRLACAVFTKSQMSTLQVGQGFSVLRTRRERPVAAPASVSSAMPANLASRQGLQKLWPAARGVVAGSRRGGSGAAEGRGRPGKSRWRCSQSRQPCSGVAVEAAAGAAAAAGGSQA